MNIRPHSLAIWRALAAASLLLLTTTARAEADEAPIRGDLLLELDPATFVLGGYSAHVRYRPAAAPRWSFGAGTYAMDLPGLLVDLDAANRHAGWNVRIRSGAALFVDRFLGEAPEGLFAGAEVGLQWIRVANPRLGSARADYTAFLLMPRAGYLWQPLGAHFYVMPWLGVGWAERTAGSAGAYHVPSVPVLATLHLGWRL
jgi:hypothetical protein